MRVRGEEFRSKAQGDASLLVDGMHRYGCCGDIEKEMKALDELENFKMEVECEMTEEHPRIFKKITLRYFFKFKGDPSKDKVEKAVNLSQNKYCGVSAMFERFLEEFSYEIVYE